MHPLSVDWRTALNDPAWTISELDYLIAICEEKKRQMWNMKKKLN
jgi:hypothetical protein